MKECLNQELFQDIEIFYLFSMGLKQLNDIQRIIFLKKFTKELIINSVKEQVLEKRIEIEKLREKFISPTLSPEEAFKKIIRNQTQEFQPSMQALPSIQGNNYLKPRMFKPMRIMPRRTFSPAMQFNQREPESLKNFKFEIQPQARQFSLGKIDLLLRDSMIKMIECPGPGMEILVRKNNKVFRTKISLSQEEITKIIDLFSAQAKIPIVGGIFKAAVGDILISALISEFVGSKFIITGISSNPAIN